MHWPRQFGRAPRPDDFIFPNKEGKGHRPKSAQNLRDALRKAKRPTIRGGKTVTFHRARHAFTGALIALDVPREVRKLLLGHAADGVDEASYAEHELAQLASQVAQIPLTWPGQATGHETAKEPAETPEPAASATPRECAETSKPTESAEPRESAETAPGLPVGLPLVLPAAIRRTASTRNLGSHLRDLNSRPTVYETVGRLAALGPEQPKSGHAGPQRDVPPTVQQPTMGPRSGWPLAPANPQRTHERHEPPNIARVVMDLMAVSTKLSSRPAVAEPEPTAVLQAFAERRAREARAGGESLAQLVLWDVLGSEPVRLALAALRGGAHADQKIVDLCEHLLLPRAAGSEHAA